jgi:uncharacterized protein (TIGR03437 family)
LIPALTSLGNDFSFPGGYPVALQAKVQDDCGVPLESGSVTAEFSNGDPPVSLAPLGGGRWDATWQSGARPSDITVTVKAASADRQIAGIRQVSGGVGASLLPPVISSGDIGDAASGAAFRPLAPGALVTISGDRLAAQEVTAPSVPLETLLATVKVNMAGLSLPLAGVAPGQITAIIPYGIPPNTRQQILVQRGDTYSNLISVNLAGASPVVFVKAGTQGMIVDAQGNLAAPGNAAHAGDEVTIYCTGLGELQQPSSAGDYGPASSGTLNAVSVSIGGRDASSSFSGLAPGLVGLYWVRVTVPAGVDSGDSVPVVVTSLTDPPAASPAVTMAIR